MKKIFCIIGLTGTGKTLYTNYILKYKNKYRGNRIFYTNQNTILKDLEPLVYGTTRAKRDTEVEGKDYYFYTKEQYLDIMWNSKSEIVETRLYNTENNGTVYYFTLKKFLDNADYYICAPSIEQLESYKSIFGRDKVAVIEIVSSTKTRINRIFNRRVKNDDDIYEMCRRILQERTDWSIRDETIDGIEDYIAIDNNIDYDFMSNAGTIMDWMSGIISRG